MLKKKLLIVTTVPDTLYGILGGQPKFLSKYYDVKLASSDSAFREQVINNEACEHHLVPMVRGINPLYDLYSIFCMVRLLIKIKPDIVHSYTPKAGMVTMVASWLCFVPRRIHTFTGLIFPTSVGFKKKILILIDRLICFCATTIVPEGLGVKNDLQRYRVTTKSLNVIGNGNIAGVDLDYFEPNAIDKGKSIEVMKSLNIGELDFTFCFVGRLNKDKGISELINAFEALKSDANLIVVGDMDTSQPIDEDLVTRCHNNNKIHMVGFQSDIRPYLAVSNVLVLPSYREGFPNVLLQAGAMGLPCIATDINGSNEILNAKNGWLVMPRDVDSLHRAMKESIFCKNINDISDNARENIIDKFDRKHYLDCLMKFYAKECSND